VIFEDEGWSQFGPLTTLRHTSLLRWGTKTLLDAITEKIPDVTGISLWGREELSAVTKDAARVGYNEKAQGPTFLVNARTRPSEGLLHLATWSEPFVSVSDGDLVAARLDEASTKPGVIGKKAIAQLARKQRKVAPPSEPLFRGYWDFVAGNGLAIASQGKHFEDLLALPRSVEVRGPGSNVMVDSGADVEGNVTFDARLGPIIIESGANIESFSRIMGPCYIGPKCKILSALIGGGTSVFEACKVGGQVDNSLIMPYTNKAHHGYVGDSYVGSWVNIGAGCTFSNLKNTYGNVRVVVGGKKADTGMVKLGPAVGDMSKLSIGSLVYAGRSVGVGSHVSGLASEDVPSFTFVDSSSNKKVELLLESVIETQRRMMERRGLNLSRNEEALIRKLFASTLKERRMAGVRKGNLG
jgi:UDP-N-acetylglucosamine diphosphorylase/glucosamine-1-phosphate N-acetyltransferase